MIALDPKCIELPVRASQSKLWEIQRNYFSTMGIEAWDDKVPFYISSNMFIAQRYANLFIQAVQDWVENDPLLQTETFYLLELGCGTGKFSFYFLQALEELIKVNKLDWLQYCYILSDVARKNIDACQANPSFAPYIQQNKIDFTLFDIVNDKDFTLISKEKRFSELNAKAPLTVIANYTFDCVEVDLFEHKEGQFFEVAIGLKSRYKNFNIAESKHLDDIGLYYSTKNIVIQNYYDDLILQDLLNEYHTRFSDANFYVPVPIGVIQFIRTLVLLTNNKYFLIAGDKGFSQPQIVPLIERKYLSSYDGCFSFNVNFHAIGEYIKQVGGDSLLTTSGGDFKVNLYSGEIPFTKMLKTAVFFETFFEKMGPYEYCSFYKEYLSNAYRYSYSGLVAFVKTSEFDPDAYTLIHERLLEILPSIDPMTLCDINNVLQRVQENIYAIKMGDDIYNLIGIFYYLTEQYDKALPLFEQSIRIFQDKSSSYHNLGLLYQKQSEIPKAIENYKKAYELDNDDLLAKHRYLSLSGKMTYRWVKPLIKGVVICGLIALAIYFSNRF